MARMRHGARGSRPEPNLGCVVFMAVVMLDTALGGGEGWRTCAQGHPGLDPFGSSA
jgi:hypothetical protein